MKSKTADTDGTIIEFMQGSHSYDGIWFGEPHPILKGQFWWRTILREYLSSGKFHHPVPDEAGEVYVWETKNPEQDLFRHPIINLTEKCHDLGWFDTKRGYWVDENGDSLGQCEWLRLSPVPLSGEDAGKGWISVEEKLPTEEDADENEKVLVYRNTNEGQKGLSKSIFDYFMVKNCDSDTMWQPLPPKP